MATRKLGKRGNGEGSISQRKTGRHAGMWEARITLADGRRKTHFTPTKEAARLWVTANLHALDQGLPIVLDERSSLGAYLADWLTKMRHQLRPRAFERYEEEVRLHLAPALGKVPLAKLTPQHLESLYRDKLSHGGHSGNGMAPRTVRHLHAVIHKALADALRLGLVARNVATVATPPRATSQSQAHPLTADECRTLIAAISGHPLEAFFLVAVTSGMRRAEILGLRWSDVDLEKGTAQVRQQVYHLNGRGYHFDAPKTDRGRRQVPLLPMAIAALRKHRARQNAARLAAGAAWVDEGLIFTNAIGHPLDGNTVLQKQFHPLLKRVGLPVVRLHDLRHGVATLAAEAGAPVGNVSDLLGHASAAFTLTVYRHAFQSSAGVAAAAMERALLGPVSQLSQVAVTAERDAQAE